MNTYSAFIEGKKHVSIKNGIDLTWVPDMAFDYQEALAERATVSGRHGVFADTGLGKTLIQITIAANYLFSTNKSVLIVAPLAVAHQFLDEAKAIGVDGMIQYRRDGKPYPGGVTVTNYDQLHNFDPNDYETVLLDESSILKNFNGGTKAYVQSFVKKIRYRFLCSATPSPNDYTELGNSSETLGRMGYMDMLSAFFKNNQNSTDSRSRNVGEKYYLKPHAETDFFAWVNTWSTLMRRPSDLGFSDDRHSLPGLTENELFVTPCSGADHSFADIRKEQRDTERARCALAAMTSHPHDSSVYWCNTNSESALLASMDPHAVELTGSMKPEKKEEILIAFQRGEIKRLVTKAKMTSMGLNWQHCNHTVFFPTYSYEQYYQAIRRFYRFGQKRDVTVDLVMSGGQSNMLRALREKRDKADKLYSQLVSLANAPYIEKEKTLAAPITLPEFLK